MKHDASNRAFTLIEILVVIAILGILMAMSIPAANAILKRTKVSNARNDAGIVVSGLLQYRLEYSSWPDFAKGQGKKHFTDHEFVETMMPDGDGAPPAENLKRVRFIEGGADVVAPGNAGGQDQFIDPWGNPFQYLVNETPRDTMGLGSFKGDYSGPEEIRANVLVWSAGPDGDYSTWTDNVVSWPED